MSPTPPLTDAEVMQQLKLIMGEQFEHLLATYIQDVGGRLAEVNDFLLAADIDALRRTFHSVAGSSLNLGVKVLANQCKYLELVADAAVKESAISPEGLINTLKDIETAMPALLKTYAQVREEIQTYLQT